MDCHALLQGIFPSQGWNPHLTSLALVDRLFTTSATWEALDMSYQSPNTLGLLHVSSSLDLIHLYIFHIPLNNSAAAAAVKSLQSCPTLCDPIDRSPQAPCPWDSPGKNTGVGCHFLLQCMKVKSESEVAQSCLTLSDPMDCSPPGSSVHGIFQATVLEWGAIAFS